MSGFVRTIQKRIFKEKFGLVRQTSRFDPDLKRLVPLKKGEGPILNGLGDNVGIPVLDAKGAVVGYNYPRVLTLGA